MSARQPTILQVLPELNTGGVERGTVDICRAIAGQGWTSLVASNGGSLAPNISYGGGEHITLPLAKKNPWAIWRNAQHLRELIRKHSIDIIHARSRGPAWSAYLATNHTPCHFVTSFHGFHRTGGFLKQKYNSIMAGGEKVIAVSHFMAEHIQEFYPTDPGKLEVIHRGVDLEVFSPEASSPAMIAKLTKEWHLPDDGRPVILLPGRLSRWKGQDFCLRALSELPHRNFLCLLVGPPGGHPDYADELLDLVLELQLDGCVRMVGGTPHMTEAYMLASLVVAPSLEPEAFGRIPTEAQAMGKPIIATRHGGACETVIHNETGWLVEPFNVEELTQAIALALNLTEEQRDIIAQNGRSNVEAHFSLEQMCHKTLDVYKEVLKKKRH